MAVGRRKDTIFRFGSSTKIEGVSTAVHPTEANAQVGNSVRSASYMRPRLNISGGLQLWPALMVHIECGRSEEYCSDLTL